MLLAMQEGANEVKLQCVFTYFIVAALSKYFCVYVFFFKAFCNSFSWKLENRFYLYLYMNLFLAGLSNIYKEAERRLIENSTLDSKYCDILIHSTSNDMKLPVSVVNLTAAKQFHCCFRKFCARSTGNFHVHIVLNTA